MKKIIPIILLIMLPLLLQTGCTEIEDSEPADGALTETGETAPPSYPVTAGGLVFADSPATAASLSPAVTEMIFELGYGDRLVCRSSYCDYPGEALELPEAGSGANPDINRIIELSPELVITQSPLANTDLSALKNAGIAVLDLPSPENPEQLCENYRTLGMIFAGETIGVQLADSCTAPLKSALRSANGSCSSLVFIMEITEQGYLTAAEGSFAGSYISEFGSNALPSGTGYLLTSDELIDADPQVIFLAKPLSSERIPQEVRDRLSAFSSGYVYVIDSSLIQRPTSRLAGVTRSISEKLREDTGAVPFTEGYAVIESTADMDITETGSPGEAELS